MAISRFRKSFAKLDPTLYITENRNLIPDITPLTNIATSMQSMWDDVSIVSAPQHLNNDANDVQAKYLNPIKEARTKAVDVFSKNNTLEGVKALRDIKAFMLEANQPGGVAYNFKANSEAMGNWQKELQARLAKGDISKDVYNHYLSTASNFKSYNDNGEYRNFSGDQPADYVDIKKFLDDAASKYKPDKTYDFQTNGIYTNKITKEIVDYNTVYKGIFESLFADDKAISYIQDLQKVYGTEEALKQINDMVKASADAAAYENKDIHLFNTDQVALYKIKKDIDKKIEEAKAAENVLLTGVPLKQKDDTELKLSSGETIDDKMQVDNNGVVLNGLYKDKDGNLYQRQTNGKYKSLTGKYGKDGKSVTSTLVPTVYSESTIGSAKTQNTTTVTGKGLTSVNLASLDPKKDKELINFLNKEKVGLIELAIKLKQENPNISPNEINTTALNRYKSSQQALTAYQGMTTFDTKGLLDGGNKKQIAGLLSSIVNNTTVKAYKNGKVIIPDDKEIENIRNAMTEMQYTNEYNPDAKYNIVGKFEKNNLLYPDNYVVVDNSGTQYYINKGNPSIMNRNLRFAPILSAINKPGRPVPFNNYPPLADVSIQNIRTGQVSNGFNIISENDYRGENLDSNTKVGQMSIISDLQFNGNTMLGYGQGSDLILKFTEKILNRETGKFDKGESYIVNMGPSTFSALNKIIENQQY